MAELNARIIAKASGTAGEAPQAADLEVAEIAVNTADGKFFTKHTDGTVKEISGGGAGFSYEYESRPNAALYEWILDASNNTPNPPSGNATYWDSYPTDRIFFSTTDAYGRDTTDDLYAITNATAIQVYIDGILKFNGAPSNVLNLNNNRVTFVIPGVDFSALENGTVIGLNSTEVWIQGVKEGEGFSLAYNADLDEWVPRNLVQSVNGKTGNATIELESLPDVVGKVPDSPTHTWTWKVDSGASPPSGRASHYAPYGDSNFFLSTTDSTGAYLESEMYAIENDTRMKVWVNGVLYYDGRNVSTLNRSSNRIDVTMPTGGDYDDPGLGNWNEGDEIGFWISTFDGAALTEGDLLSYDGEVWRPTLPSSRVAFARMPSDS